MLNFFEYIDNDLHLGEYYTHQKHDDLHMINYLNSIKKVSPRASKSIVRELKIKKLSDFLKLTEEDLLSVDEVGIRTVKRIMKHIQ
jgi:NAD-dependent DNA ligase